MTARPGWKPTGTPITPLPVNLPAQPRTPREGTGTRNGLPGPGGYTWHGDGTIETRDTEVETQLARIRRRAARSTAAWRATRERDQERLVTEQHRLDMQEAVDGMSHACWRELADGNF